MFYFEKVKNVIQIQKKIGIIYGVGIENVSKEKMFLWTVLQLGRPVV